MTRTLLNASAKGAPNCLNVLPLAEEGYVLNKEEFRDVMAMRYSKHILGLPSKCACGSNFVPVHALDCKKCGFIHSRHDQLRNLEAKMLSDACQDIEIEPQLQPLTGENMSLQSANIEDSARLDMKARGFYRQGQCAFFDIRVAHLTPCPIESSQLTKFFAVQSPKRKEVTIKGSLKSNMGHSRHQFLTQIVQWAQNVLRFIKFWQNKFAQKSNKKYCEVMSSIRTKISFNLIRSTILCLRGSRKY